MAAGSIFNKWVTFLVRHCGPKYWDRVPNVGLNSATIALFFLAREAPTFRATVVVPTPPFAPNSAIIVAVFGVTAASMGSDSGGRRYLSTTDCTRRSRSMAHRSLIM